MGGIYGGINNVTTGNGSFVNGFLGGAINGAITVGFAGIVNPFGSNLIGGTTGSIITDLFNYIDNPEIEEGFIEQLIVNATVAGMLQSIVGGGLSHLWNCATNGGWTVVNQTGTNLIATIIWESYFAGSISSVVGMIASVISSEINSEINNEIVLPDIENTKNCIE